MEEIREPNVTPKCIDNPESKKYPIDYCMIIMDGMQPFVELHFESLMKTETFDSFASLHIVDKLTSDGTIDYCRKMYPKVQVHSLGFYYPLNRLGNTIPHGWQWDMAYSYEYALQNCGTAPWIFMIHPDVVFWNAKEYFEGIHKMMYPEVGMIWERCATLHRREAHWQCCIKFWPLFGANYAYTNESLEKGFLIHAHDPRAKDMRLVQVQGIETWELLCLELQNLDWVCPIIPHELYLLKDHMAQCSRHDFDPNNKEQRKHFETKMNLVQHRLSRLRAGQNNYM